MKAICVLSGGLDSTVAMAIAKLKGYEICPITFNYGQRAVNREIASSKKLAEIFGVLDNHKVINLDFIKQFSNSALTNENNNIPTIENNQLDNLEVATKTMEKVWVPARNLTMFSIASGYGEYINGQVIFTGLNYEEGATFPDNTKEFLNRFNSVLEYGTLNKIKMEAPLYNNTKKEIVKIGKELEDKLGFKFLKYSYSCYYDNGEDFIHCGVCESCMRRKRAFKESGIIDNTIYLK